MNRRTTKPPKDWGKKIISYQRFLQAQSEARTRASEARAEREPIPAEADPSVRIARVRERISQGFYNRPDVLEELASRLLSSLPPAETAEETPSTR